RRWRARCAAAALPHGACSIRSPREDRWQPPLRERDVFVTTRGAMRSHSVTKTCSGCHRSGASVSVTAELTRLDETIERGTRRLLELQRPDGIWVGELESNVTMTAQHLFWNHFLGLRTSELDRRIANELLARMRD